MGDQSTINLLSNINGSLNKIVEMMLPQNKDRGKEEVKKVKNLSQGGLSSSNTVKPTAPAAGNDISLNLTFAQIIGALQGLPEYVKMIAKLSGSTVNNFNKVLTTIAHTFADDAFKNIDSETAKSSKLMFDAIISMKDLPEAIKLASKVKEKDVKIFASTITKMLNLVAKDLRKTKVSKEDIELAKNTATVINQMATSIKSMAKMTIIAPLALVGILAMIPVWAAFSVVAMLIGKLEAPINKGLKVLKGVDQIMANMLKSALLALVVAGGVLLLGHFMTNHSDAMVKGLIALAGVFVLMTLVSGLAWIVGKLAKGAEKSLKHILFFTLGLVAVGLSVLLLGALVNTHRDEMFAGLIAVGGMLLLTLLVAGVAWIVGQLGLTMAKTKAMAGLLLIILGLTAMAALTVLLGTYVSKHWKEALVGLAATAVILGEVYAIAQLAIKVGKKAKEGAMSLLICEGVILGAMVIVWATIKTGKLVWDYFGTDTGTAIAKVLVVTAVASAIILGAAQIAKLASKNNKDIKKGALGLLLAEGVILGAALVTTAVIGVSKLMESVDGESLTKTLLTMTLIIGATGAMAVLASKLQASLMKGALAMAVIELLVLGAVGIVYAVVKTAEAATQLPNGFDDVLTTVEYMGLLIGGFALVTMALGAFVFNPFVAIALAAGAGVLLAIGGLIYHIANVTDKALQVKKDIDDSKISIPDLADFLKDITKNLFSYDTLDPDIDAIDAFKLSLKYKALKPALEGITTIIDVISSMAKQFGGLSEKRGDDYYISPFYGMNGTEPVFGEPVNVPMIARDIVAAVSAFGTTLETGFKGVDLDKIEDIGETMSYIVEPVSKFAQMLTLFRSAGPGNLIPVFLVDGQVKEGDPVNVHEVAVTISGCLVAFAKGIYGTEDDMPEWLDVMGDRSTRNHTERAMQALNYLLDPLDKFINAIMGYESSGYGLLRKIQYDKTGNPTDTGKFVNVVHVAGIIAASLSIFGRILYGGDADWLEELGDEDVQEGIYSLRLILSPIHSFIDALLQLDPNGSEIYNVQIDANGNVHRRKVNLAGSALAISSAISIFVKTLFSKENSDTWVSLTERHYLRQKDPTIKTAMGVFGSIVEPIAKFATVISEIGGETEDGNLLLPIYDKDGKKVGTKKIDLVNTANIIANAVTSFVKTLFSKENFDMWTLLIHNPHTGQRTSTVADAVGIFGSIIDPVVKFAEVVSKFGGTADAFEIYDGEKSRTINLIETANAIASSVVTFMNAIRPAFDKIEFSNKDKQRITDFADTMGSILENFAKIGETKIEQIKTAENIMLFFFKTLNDVNEQIANVPKTQDIIVIKETMIEVNSLFHLFDTTEFEDLTYKKGLQEFKYVVKEIASVEPIIKKLDPTISFGFIKNYARAITDLYTSYILAQYHDITTRNITNAINTITLMSNAYNAIPNFGENDKLRFVNDYATALGSLVQSSAASYLFIQTAPSIISVVNAITKSITELSPVPVDHISGLSTVYNGMINGLIGLSTNENNKSLKGMHKSIDEVTASVTSFDKQLLKNADKRKRQLEELTKEVGKLNAKLEETGKNLETITKTINDADIDKLNNINTSSSSESTSLMGRVFGKSSSAPATTTTVVQNAGTSSSTIENAILNALTKLKLDSDAMPANVGGGSLGSNNNSEITEFMNAFMRMFANMDYKIVRS